MKISKIQKKKRENSDFLLFFNSKNVKKKFVKWQGVEVAMSIWRKTYKLRKFEKFISLAFFPSSKCWKILEKIFVKWQDIFNIFANDSSIWHKNMKSLQSGFLHCFIFLQKIWRKSENINSDFMGVQFQISDSLGKNLSNDKTITALHLERMSHQFDVKIQKLKIIFILTLSQKSIKWQDANSIFNFSSECHCPYN